MKWDDGSVLDTDPRREDPLFYYLTKGDWSKAIGFEVLPLYEEAGAEQVQISVFANHRPREAAIGDSEREQLYVRAIPALAKRHRKWRQLTLNAIDLDQILASGALTDELQRLGFRRLIGSGRDQAAWSRD